MTGIDRDFFVRNYPEPIFEDGIQLFDRLRLTLEFSDTEGGSAGTSSG